jgi:hypothetical protein
LQTRSWIGLNEKFDSAVGANVLDTLPGSLTVWQIVVMDRDEILAKLREYAGELKAAGVEHLFLHGSYARGTATLGSSDVDVIGVLPAGVCNRRAKVNQRLEPFGKFAHYTQNTPGIGLGKVARLRTIEKLFILSRPFRQRGMGGRCFLEHKFLCGVIGEW